MVLPRKQNKITYDNGNTIRFQMESVPAEVMQRALEHAEEAYEKNATQLHNLEMIYAKGDLLFGKGDYSEAADYLEKELAAINGVETSPENLIAYLDVLSLTAEILLYLKRPKDAFHYADEALELAQNHFDDSWEFIYVEEVYATLCVALGKNDLAKKFYSDALARLNDELDNAESLKEHMEEALADLNEE